MKRLSTFDKSRTTSSEIEETIRMGKGLNLAKIQMIYNLCYSFIGEKILKAKADFTKEVQVLI